MTNLLLMVRRIVPKPEGAIVVFATMSPAVELYGACTGDGFSSVISHSNFLI